MRAAAGEPGGHARGEQPREHGRPRSPATPPQPGPAPRCPLGPAPRCPLGGPAVPRGSHRCPPAPRQVLAPVPRGVRIPLQPPGDLLQRDIFLGASPSRALLCGVCHGEARWPAPRVALGWPWGGFGYQRSPSGWSHHGPIFYDLPILGSRAWLNTVICL